MLSFLLSRTKSSCYEKRMPKSNHDVDFLDRIEEFRERKAVLESEWVKLREQDSKEEQELYAALMKKNSFQQSFNYVEYMLYMDSLNKPHPHSGEDMTCVFDQLLTELANTEIEIRELQDNNEVVPRIKTS